MWHVAGQLAYSVLTPAANAGPRGYDKDHRTLCALPLAICSRVTASASVNALALQDKASQRSRKHSYSVCC